MGYFQEFKGEARPG